MSTASAGVLPDPYHARLLSLAERLSARLATEPEFRDVQQVIAALEYAAAPYIGGTEPLAAHHRAAALLTFAWRQAPAAANAHDRLVAAFHEAGHAIAALVLGLSVREVRANGNEGGLTWLDFAEPRPTRALEAHQVERVTAQVVCWLAGAQAELIEFGTTQEPLANHHDEREARQIALALRPTDEGVRLFLALCRHDARTLLQLHWGAVRELALRLAEHETVSGEEAAAILAPSLASPPNHWRM